VTEGAEKAGNTRVWQPCARSERMVATRAFPGRGKVVLPAKARGIQRLAGPGFGQGEARIVSTAATTGVAGRYASALFELADNAKALDQVAQDLDTFKKLLAESGELSRLIASQRWIWAYRSGTFRAWTTIRYRVPW